MLLRTTVISFICSLLTLSQYGGEQMLSDSLYPGDREMWHHIINSGPPTPLRDKPLGVILPHHAIVTREMARCYRGIAQQITPKKIIIIGPDHYETGAGPIVTTDAMHFPSVYGTLEPDAALARELVNAGLAGNDNRVFVREHAIYTHAPFVRHHFPDARILPILIRWGTPVADLDRLAEWIARHMDDSTLVIASVDFSHYQPRAIADFHDARSLRAIRNFSFDVIPFCEIDSPASLHTLMRVMQSKGYGTAERILHTNSDDLVGRQEAETTSHQYFAFTKGKPARTKGLSLLVTGNISGTDDNMMTRTNWQWDRSYRADNDPSLARFLRNLRGTEDRFFTGADLVLMDIADSEQVYTSAGSRIMVIRAIPGQYSSPEIQMHIQDQKRNAEYLFVLYHIPHGLFSSSDRIACHKMIDAGADLVIVRGLSAVLPPERYNEGVIFPSCGDFVTPGFTAQGEVHGVDFDGENIRIYTQGIKIEHGFPRVKMNHNIVLTPLPTGKK